MSFGEEDYNIAKAATNYQSGLAGQTYARGVRDWNLQRTSGMQKMYSGLANRGLINSGIKRQDLGKYGEGTLRGYGDLRSALDQAIAQLVFQNMGSAMDYADPRFMKAISEGTNAALSQADMAQQYRNATQ